MAEYTWRATGLRDYPAEPGAVYWCAWDLTSSSGGYIDGEVPLIQWLPYNELTTDILVGWVKESIGPEQVAAYERDL